MLESEPTAVPSHGLDAEVPPPFDVDAVRPAEALQGVPWPAATRPAPVRSVPAWPTAARPGVDGSAAAASLRLRRLAYYAALLRAGYRHALDPEPLPTSLRSERIALGIAVPELDAVPLWSSRRPDGAVSVPFIDFLLGRIEAGLDELAATAATSSAACEALRACRRDVLAALTALGAEGGRRQSVPMLRDLYFPPAELADVCGPGGVLERAERLCDILLASIGPRIGL